MLKAIVNSPVRSGDQTIIDGNLVIGTAGKGVDFSADSHTAGMTSELFDDYEEGAFTPNDASGAGLTFTNASGKYTKIGRQVFVKFTIEYPATADASATAIGGLPFTSSNDGLNNCGAVICNANLLTFANVPPNSTLVNLFDGANLNQRTNADFTGKTAIVNLTYMV